ncbi:hypothetical protein DDA93_03940 [Arthrobacter sp. Bz4]|nr:hypothetical protein DDA93_03940 [Arthrobacter sp. Bz4]
MAETLLFSSPSAGEPLRAARALMANLQQKKTLVHPMRVMWLPLRRGTVLRYKHRDPTAGPENPRTSLKE